MRITLIRHTSVDVPKGTCYGWSDVPVRSTFAEEAAITKGNLSGNSFDVVYSSPLSRALLLAEYCGYAEPAIDDRLKEMNMGDWEMRRFDEIEDRNLQKWYDNYLTQPTTNGESFQQFYNRVVSFLEELRDKPYDNVAIFAHGGVLLCAGIYAGLFSMEDCFNHITPYGGIMNVEI